MSVASIIAEIITDAGLAADLVSKVKGNIAKAKEVLASNPDASLSERLADAKAKLASIQADAAEADAEFGNEESAVAGRGAVHGVSDPRMPRAELFRAVNGQRAGKSNHAVRAAARRALSAR